MERIVLTKRNCGDERRELGRGDLTERQGYHLLSLDTRQRVKIIRSKPAESFPRSSNGRTAAFGAVNRGSNPCRGANLLLQQLISTF